MTLVGRNRLIHLQGLLLCANCWAALLNMWRLLTLILLAGSGYVTADVYRWIDENGLIHFSDKSQAGAEQIKLRSLRVYAAIRANLNPIRFGTKTEADSSKDSGGVLEYEVISIVSPEKQSGTAIQ